MRIPLHRLKGSSTPPPGLSVDVQYSRTGKSTISLYIAYPNLAFEDTTHEEEELGLDTIQVDQLHRDVVSYVHKQGAHAVHPLYPLPPDIAIPPTVSALRVSYPSHKKITTLYTVWMGSLHALFRKVLKDVFTTDLSIVRSGVVDVTSDTTDRSGGRYRTKSAVDNRYILKQGIVDTHSISYTMECPVHSSASVFGTRLHAAVEDMLQSKVSPLLSSKPPGLVRDENVLFTVSPRPSFHLDPGDSDLYTVDRDAASLYFCYPLTSLAYQALKYASRARTRFPSVYKKVIHTLMRRYPRDILVVKADRRRTPVTYTQAVNINYWSRVYSVSHLVSEKPIDVSGAPVLAALALRIGSWIDSNPCDAIKGLYPLLVAYGFDTLDLSDSGELALDVFLSGDSDTLPTGIQFGVTGWIKTVLQVPFIRRDE
jgi:hypothetical protein